MSWRSLAAQLGFLRVGSHVDEIDGFEEILERTILSDDAEPVADLWQVALYLLVTGAFFAAGVVFDGKEDLRALHGRDTQLALWSRFASVAAAVWVASGLAVAMSRSASRVHREPTEGE